jgi:hypothetical protein
MRRELQKQYAASNNNETVAVRRAACWWMTGDATGCNSGQMVTYVQNVLRFYQQARSKPTNQPASNSSQSSTPQNK